MKALAADVILAWLAFQHPIAWALSRLLDRAARPSQGGPDA